MKIRLLCFALAGVLSGCDTMAPVSYAPRSTPASAQQLPRLDDPQMQSMLDAVAVEYRKYRASGKRYLERPAEAGRWPCAVSTAQLNKLAGTVDTDKDPVKKREFINYARSWHTEPSKVTYSNQIFYPVQASCGKGGKLQGPVDFWVEYDSTNGNSTLQIHSHVLSHLGFIAKDGERSGLVMQTSQVLKTDTAYSDPNTAALMAKQAKHDSTSITFAAVRTGEPADAAPASVEVHYFDFDSNATKVTLSSTVTHPLGANRYENIRYGVFGDSMHKDLVTPYKDGKMHGWAIRYASTTNGITMPGDRTCWQDGEKIMTTTCRAD